MSGFLKIGLILFLLATGGRVFCFPLPGKDSLKTKFDLNDPRSPDCPCHKYQRQAEREYALLQQKSNRDSHPEVDTIVNRTKGTAYWSFQIPLFHWNEISFRRYWRKKNRKTKRFHQDHTRCGRW